MEPLKLEHKTTNRGFDYINFTEAYGHACSVQKSSLATEDAIWLGVDDAKPQIRGKPVGTGWVPYPIPDDVLLTTRMHLTRDQVAQLIPVLQHFVDCGEVPNAEELAQIVDGTSYEMKLDRDMEYARVCFERVTSTVGDCTSVPDFWQARQALESLASAIARLTYAVGMAESALASAEI